ncbi:Protein of unknown function [Streptococcus thermophilus]|nr:Protein of unknown function [Streptococcus thermophilus]
MKFVKAPKNFQKDNEETFYEVNHNH